MSYPTLAVVVTDLATDTPALGTAVRMAQRTEAHLDVYCLGIDPARYDVMPVGGGMAVLESGAAEARTRAEELVKSVEAAMPKDLARCTVQELVLPQMGLEPMLARSLRYADLVIAVRPYAEGRAMAHVAPVEAALFGATVPVLVLPDGKEIGSEAFDHVVLAWNESDEAMAATRAALPLLKAASRVDIVMVDPPSHSPERSDPGGNLCLMLSRHGVRAEVSILARTMPREADVLARYAREHDADLMVLGAYGHSRFREAILGGVTRDSLEKTEIPLFLAR